MTRTHATLAGSSATVQLAPPLQAESTVTVPEPLVGLFIVSVGLSVLFGLATATLAVVRYRRRGDPSLRAFVVGLVLVAVAPLPFWVFLIGTIPPTVRGVVPPLFQTAGLLALLWAMYGTPDPDGRRLLRAITRGDLLVVALAVVAAAVTGVLTGQYEPDPAGVVGAAFVVGLSTVVAAQATRAAYRFRSRSMATLSLGVLLLATLPTPVGALLLATDSFAPSVVVGVVTGAILLGEAAMFATLASR
ncbi:DUF7521 family protein [Halobaculum marinum]|uniref:Uncharacterized protein n=1 Tax=Halobaculum marinum TaxID=3031996 RepID=A0ABD5X1S4_9EURY|nr:hypothetical protein [Halobaculum sp. DT55]